MFVFDSSCSAESVVYFSMLSCCLLWSGARSHVEAIPTLLIVLLISQYLQKMLPLGITFWETWSVMFPSRVVSCNVFQPPFVRGSAQSNEFDNKTVPANHHTSVVLSVILTA
jgi:hypothetical protein